MKELVFYDVNGQRGVVNRAIEIYRENGNWRVTGDDFSSVFERSIYIESKLKNMHGVEL